MRRVVVAGGSIAAVTAAESLRLQGYEGEITLLSDENRRPYSRVPLSKGVLSGKESPESVSLPALGEDIITRLGAEIVGLKADQRRVILADGEEVPYDGLVIATGARARRLSHPGQVGEQVLRSFDDASSLSLRLAGAQSVIIVGAGFLGMEIASTCLDLGLKVTVIDRDRPLRRLLGDWLSEQVVGAAQARGVKFLQARTGVELLGEPDVCGIRYDDQLVRADIVVSAAGDVPNVEWLKDSGLPLNGGVIVDALCRVSSRIVAAGDVAVTRYAGDVYRRSPHWTSAVVQAQTAAAALFQGENAVPQKVVPYYWTEQFGLELKISGAVPECGAPSVLAGDVSQQSALLQWLDLDGDAVAAAAVNHRIPIVKLKRLGAPTPVTSPV